MSDIKSLGDYWKELSVGKRGMLIAAIPISCLVTSLGIFGWLQVKMSEAGKWVDHTHQVRLSAERLLSKLIDAETGMRGYVLTQNQELLADYQEAIAVIPESLEKLRYLVQDNPKQSQRILEIKNAVENRLDHLQYYLTLNLQMAESEAALSEIMAASKMATNRTRSKLKLFIAEEERLLMSRKQTLKSQREMIWIALYGSAALGVASSILAAVLFRRIDRSLSAEKAQSRQHAQRFRDTFEQAAVGIAHVDYSGKIMRCNQKFCEIVGYEREELLNRTLREITYGEDVDEDWKYFSQLLAAKITTYSREKRYIRKQGDIVWANLTVSLASVEKESEKQEQSTGKYAIGVIEDITERKQAEAELNRFFDLSMDMLAIGGSNGYLKRVNPAVEKILGYSISEFLATPWIEFIHPEDKAASKAEVDRILAGCQTTEFENRFRSKDGDYKWLAWMARAIATEGLFYSVARDITDRKQAEAAKEREYQQLREIIANAPVAIAMLDNQMCYIAYSKKWLEDYQLQGELLGRSHYEVFLKQPDRWIEVHQRALTGEVISSSEDPIEYRDGTVGYISWEIHPWYAERGKIGGVAIATNKIDELVQAREAALENARLKSQFLANMSHEIRTPMNGVLGMAGLLSKTELTRKQQDFINAIHTSAQHLLLIINDILDFSKLEAGEMELERLDFDLYDCLETAIDLLATQVEEKGLELGLLVDPNVPRQLQGDPGRLRQVLVNLMGNAIKFTDKGSVVVRVKLPDRRRRTPNKICFEVTDTGIGIPTEAREKLFQSFSQVDASTTRQYGGTGLGLAICKQLVELMGGTIGVESAVGRGSTFWFTAKFARSTTRKPSRREVLTDLKLLVADSSATVRQSLRYLTDAWGMRLDEVADGKAALKHLRQAATESDPYDVALFDEQLLNELAQIVNSEIPQTKLVVMTPMNQRDRPDRLTNIRVSSQLVKPVRPSRLFDTLITAMANEIETVLESRRYSSTPPQQETTTHQPLEGLKILLVEDHPINQEVMLNQLSIIGYEADLAGNGQEALDLLQQKDYDLVFMDCQMPVKDGYLTTQELRQMEAGSGRHTIVIALTAHAMPADREKCLAAGMDDYISKPVEQEDLEILLNRWTESRRGKIENEVGSEVVKRSDISQPERSSIDNDNPPLDLKRLNSISKGRVEFQQRLLRVFMEKAEVDIAALGEAIAHSDFDQIQSYAHRLKGSSANVGASEVRAIAAQIETLARENTLANSQELFASMEAELDLVRTFIQDHFQK
ncbi:MAG: PAS domain S-box protein [Hormoscilla sp.]